MSSKTLLYPPATEDYEHDIYIPFKTVNDFDPQTPWVIENPENHGGEGGNVLFGDAHVEWVQGPELEQMLEGAGAKIPPPPG